MINIAQSYLIWHVSINCMLPLVIPGFPQFSGDFSVPGENFCNLLFDSVQLGLLLG